jgi:hypothetical protein
MAFKCRTLKVNNDHIYLCFPQITLAPILSYTSVPLQDALKSQGRSTRKPRNSVDPEKYLDGTGDTYYTRIQIRFVGK